MNPATTENADQTLGEASWFENETFWEAIYPFIFIEERFTTAEAEVAELAKLTGTPFRKVLDLCCGPGRHSIPLARQGAQVTAVDRSPFLLEKGSIAGGAGKTHDRMGTRGYALLRSSGEFDLVINLFTSFGYFGEIQEDLAVLKNVFNSLTPGGCFVIDLMGKEIIARRFSPSAVDKLPDGSILVQMREITDDWYRIRSHWFLSESRAHGSSFRSRSLLRPRTG